MNAEAVKIERAVFEGLVKDAVANLYDVTALETHPLLLSAFQPPPGFTGQKGEYVRRLVIEGIEQLRPERRDETAPEWRPFLILHRRYVEGMSVPSLAASLAVSDRQMRRDHHRALQALTTVLWERLYGDERAVEESPQPFETRPERINLQDTLAGVYRILRARLEEEGVRASLELPETPAEVDVDRVVLRQILISMMADGLHELAGDWLAVRLSRAESQAVITVELPVSETWEPGEGLTAARYWSERIQARLDVTTARRDGQRLARRVLGLAGSAGKVVLVIDDQGAAINLFRRLLAGSGYDVAGSNQPLEALALARQIRPALIILDVMMPGMDGWEVLQTLKLNEDTRAIPVLVCSAWEEPELSRSLGAAGFLKKPVTQKALQEALKRLGQGGSVETSV